MPKLKAILDSLDELAEPLREYYEEKDGKFLLQAEGVVLESDIAAMRNAKQQAVKERNEALKKLEPFKNAAGELMKPDEIHAAMDELEQLRAEKEAGGGKDDEARHKAIEAAVKREKAPLQRQIDALTKERDLFKTSDGEKDGKIRRMTLENEINKLIPGSGIKDSAAARDLMLFAERELTISEDGKVITREDVDGLPVGMDAKAWLSEHVKSTRGYLFPQSQGAGAGGGNGGSGGSEKNPYTREHWSLGAQAAIEQVDRAKAERLAQQAGTTLGGGMPPAKKAAV